MSDKQEALEPLDRVQLVTVLATQPLAATSSTVQLGSVHPHLLQPCAQLPPKARFSRAYKQRLLIEQEHGATSTQTPPRGNCIDSDSVSSDLALTHSSVHHPVSRPSIARPKVSQLYTVRGHDRPSSSAKRQLLENALDLGSNSPSEARVTHIDSDEDSDIDPLHWGSKALRLSVSKIQGRAEPRKPRIGPQYQACVPPWPPGL